MPSKKPLTGRALQEAVVNDYLAGALPSQLMERYEIGRSTVYSYLKRSGKVPRRFATGEESTDLMLAGLRELVRHLETENDELRRENAQLRTHQQQQAG